MEVVPVLVAITLPLFLLFILKNCNARKSNRHAPGPPGLPLIRNMLQFDSLNTHIYLHHLSKKYGPLMSLKLGSVKILVISSVSAAKEVFKFHDLCISNRPSSVAIQKLSYNKLGFCFAPYDEYWRSMRKFSALHLFNAKSLRSFQPIRDEEIARMVRTIRDAAAADSSVVDLSKTFMTLTSSIIFRITFDYFPLMGRFLDRLNGAWARLEKSFRETDAFYQQLIDEHLLASSLSTGDCSILDILLEMKKDSPGFTFDHVKAILMNIILAATDTSAAAIIWAMTLLIKNPASMEKVQQEVRDLGRQRGFVDEDDIEKLVYLKAVVKEVLRLWPPAPILRRETTEKCVVSGYDIEAKTWVYVNTYAIGRDPECWDNPDEFLPERFMNNSIDFRGQDFELIPFGAGRRICPGISMGATTTELVLANLLYSFNWELPPGKNREDIDMAAQPGLTVHKKNHLCLVPKIGDQVSHAYLKV
ncbi:cytochrome P450 71B34 isoform X2 [Daucus carota subsp. sativus]|uniref:cytochrome P450 71B34 isoform X2 n=1 Tax=Daucus carota subsp. sativus TaxID=79200 RepID=UPI0007EF463E|nr:PREDICTED: cytochrome P450 71B34-like isoform X2 [Daucus carota subsp. sativus]